MVDFFVGFSGDVSDTLWCHFRHALVSFQTRSGVISDTPPFSRAYSFNDFMDEIFPTKVTKVTIVKKGT